MTAAEALRPAVARLTAAGIDGAARDARLILAAAMGLAADRLTLHLDVPLSPSVSAAFDAGVAARMARQPVSQITGHRQFWGRRFHVTRDTLDPRPETETLIAVALDHPATPRRILDLGTGTGAILLTLLTELPGATGHATDISPAALSVAVGNAAALGVADRASFALSDWFDDVTGQFDLIVSNPPYIAEAEWSDLSPDVRDWEPRQALTPGGDGLVAYRAIASGLGRHLAPGGRVLLEIGPTQAVAVSSLLREAGLSDIAIAPDLDGRDRVVIAHIR